MVSPIATHRITRGIVATEGGAATNIGKDCGKREFGVDFETLSRKFDSDIQARNNREILATFTFALESLKSEIRDLRESQFGADWLNRRIEALTHRGKGWPDSVVGRVNAMAQARSGRLIKARFASQEEIDISDIRLRRDNYSDLTDDDDQAFPRRVIEEAIGEIQGVAALYPENDVRKILIFELEKKLSAFERLDIDNMTQTELRDWARWTTSVEALLERARMALAAGRQLFARENLQQFVPVVDRSELAEFRSSLKQLP